jgi:hypothetical protein
MVTLKIIFEFPGDRHRRGLDPSNHSPSSRRFLSVGDALDAARTLLWDEGQRQRKTPHKLPALVKLEVILEDGSILDDATIREEAPKIRN